MFPDPRGTPRLTGSRSLFGRIVAALATIGAILVGLMFSAVVFAAAIVVGLAVWGWIWWKMRRVLKQARQDPRFQQFRDMAAGGTATPSADGKVIDGEVLHEEWKDERARRR